MGILHSLSFDRSYINPSRESRHYFLWNVYSLQIWCYACVPGYRRMGMLRKLGLLSVSDACPGSLPFCVGSFYGNFEATQDVHMILMCDI